jgi:hypothetical protein
MNTPTIVSAPREWLTQWPAGRRSLRANLFHFAVRHGACTPGAVVAAVVHDLQRRLQWGDDPTLAAVLEQLQSDPAPALQYAGTVIAYEHLLYAARQRVKAERATPYLQEAMRGKPITDKQSAYLRALGHTGPQPEDRATASALIDRLTREGVQP